jgi:hypothetical protein
MFAFKNFLTFADSSSLLKLKYLTHSYVLPYCSCVLAGPLSLQKAQWNISSVSLKKSSWIFLGSIDYLNMLIELNIGRVKFVGPDLLKDKWREGKTVSSLGSTKTGSVTIGGSSRRLPFPHPHLQSRLVLVPVAAAPVVAVQLAALGASSLSALSSSLSLSQMLWTSVH